MEGYPSKGSTKPLPLGLVTPVKKTRLYKLNQSSPAERQSNDYAMRSTFNPPESPNDLFDSNPHFKSLGQDLSELKPTIPSDVYAGVNIHNTHVENTLSDYPSSSTNDKSSVTDCVDDLMTTPSSTRYGTSFQTSIDSTPSKSITGGVDKLSGSSNPNQAKTFEQLAEEHGVRPWDSQKIDDRWALDPHEVKEQSPEAYAHQESLCDEDMGYCSSPVESLESAESAESENGGVSLAAFEKSIVKAKNQSTVKTQSQSYLPLPPEVARLERLISDVTSAVVRIDKPFCSRITRLYFYDRVFGSRDGPEPLSTEEATKMTIYQGKTKTFAELRCDVLGAVDDLAEWYSSPAGQGIRERDSQLAEQSVVDTASDIANYTPAPTGQTDKMAGVCIPNVQTPFQSNNNQQYYQSSALDTYQLPLGYPNTGYNPMMQTQMQMQFPMWPGQHAQNMAPCMGVRAAGHYPNGITIPSDRFARPPATNRRAPLFAQNGGAWQANNQNHQGLPKAPVLNNLLTKKSQEDNRRLAYIEGSDTMFPNTLGASIKFQTLTKSQPCPDHSIVTHVNNVPFAEVARSTKAAQWGVLKLGNIPYDMTKASVYQFLGNHAKIITSDFGPSVHIIMDRATGKTQDCYVEFFSTPDAQACQRNIQYRGPGYNRISDRLIEVTISSQDAILGDLFPRAKNVVWTQGQPVVQAPQEPYNTGFKTFISAEELGILVRHVEQPQRCSYISKCHTRPYEAMISLLAKFPWQAVEYYTLATRNKIFEAALRMTEVLCRDVRRSGVNSKLYGTQQQAAMNRAVLRDLVNTAINCPFSERQRWTLYMVASDVMGDVYRVSSILQFWPFEVLGRIRNVEDDVVEWYAKLMASHPEAQSNAPPDGPFGRVCDIHHADESKTMDVVGSEEWNLMGRLIAEMCDPQMWNAARIA